VSEQLPAPLLVVCRVAGVSRSAACEARRRRGTSEPPRRRPGPVGAMTDSELLAEIRDVLASSPFVGGGHRKVWARLRRRGVCTSRKRVLRLTRGAGLLAPTARVRKRAQRLHDGTITVTVPDTLWATDATEGWSEEGRCAVFVMIDHASGEAWADAGLRMDRFAAADLLREVTTERFGSVDAAVAAGLALRYDGGPCFRSERALVALLAPLPQMRAIQPLAAQQRADLTRLRAPIGLTHDRQLVRRGEPPTRTALDELRVRDHLRRDAPAGGETQLAYGSLRSSTGAIQLRPGIHP
jgi:HTH-like domain